MKIILFLRINKEKAPFSGRPTYRLAAAAAIFAALGATGVTAAAEQQKQNDDPPAGVTAKHTVITHNEYLQEIFLQQLLLIPRYSGGEKMCLLK